MSKFFLTVLLCNIAYTGISQGRAFAFDSSTFYIFKNPRPHDFNEQSSIMQNGIHQQMVFSYNTKKLTSDSELVVAKFFDSSGLCIEKDDYENNIPICVTNFRYVQGLLVMIHIVMNQGIYNDIILTYEYDSAGNKTNEKIFSRSSIDPSNKYELRSAKKWEYDSQQHLTMCFDTAKGSWYVSSVYQYEDDTLREIKHLNEDKKNTETFFYVYDNATYSKMIYKTKNKKQLLHQYNYDKDGNLLKQRDCQTYSDDINTLTYVYKNGLLITELFHSKYDDDLYYKSYYN